MLTSLESQYQSSIDAMSPQERVARSTAMFEWFRDMMGRQIRQEFAANGRLVSDEELKLHIALRMYESEPAVTALIRGRLEDVSH